MVLNLWMRVDSMAQQTKTSFNICVLGSSEGHAPWETITEYIEGDYGGYASLQRYVLSLLVNVATDGPQMSCSNIM